MLQKKKLPKQCKVGDHTNSSHALTLNNITKKKIKKKSPFLLLLPPDSFLKTDPVPS